MLERLYYYFHRKTSLPEEQGKYSAGCWEGRIRKAASSRCRRSSGKLLEVGCGEGLFLARMALENPALRLFGVDSHMPRLKEALASRLDPGQHSGYILINADGGFLPFAAESFETVVCLNVFLNIADFQTMKRLISEMVRVCSPGGRVVFDFRNSRNPFLRLKFSCARFYDKTLGETPLSHFDPSRISALMSELGVSSLQEEPLGFPRRLCAPIIIIEARK